MTSDGVAIPLTLSHRMLGQLVGARRPTVSTAIGELAERGELVRRADGTWLLKGDPVGLPAGEAQRLIPIRRKLIGRLTDEPAELTGNGHEIEAQPVVGTAFNELRATLERVRADTGMRLERMRELGETSEQVRRQTLTRRAERAAARDERVARAADRASGDAGPNGDRD